MVSDEVQSKEDLMASIAATWQQVQEAIADLSAEQMALPRDGGWSVKDHLAHLAFWEQYMLRHHLDGEPAHEVFGVDEAAYQRLDIDSGNDIVYRRNRDRALQDVLDGLNRSHAQVLARLSAMSWEALLRPDAEDAEGRPILLWVRGNTDEHYLEHLPLLR